MDSMNERVTYVRCYMSRQDKRELVKAKKKKRENNERSKGIKRGEKTK